MPAPAAGLLRFKLYGAWGKALVEAWSEPGLNAPKITNRRANSHGA